MARSGSNADAWDYTWLQTDDNLNDFIKGWAGRTSATPASRSRAWTWSHSRAGSGRPVAQGRMFVDM